MENKKSIKENVKIILKNCQEILDGIRLYRLENKAKTE